MSTPWTLAALPPLPLEVLEALFADVPVELVVPAERTPAAARVAVADADVVLGDWSGALRVDADLISAAPRLSFVQQPSAGVDAIDVERIRKLRHLVQRHARGALLEHRDDIRLLVSEPVGNLALNQFRLGDEPINVLYEPGQ